MYDLLPKVKTSKNTSEIFDPKKIEKSLVEETFISLEQANDIAIELTRRIIAYKIKVLTSPEIREMVCSILLEKNYDIARFRYTRLGLPFYDFDKLISSNISQIESNQKFLQLEKILNDEIRKNNIYSQIEFEYKEIKKILNDIS
ncbi:MAG: hypothetical protein KGD63_13535 [Candidatus Lokiarchaeota archaeon]|nr:hypothetical protein [Candidatus Lokiarchaeota archaeon]